jgi:hypothetical protein
MLFSNRYFTRMKQCFILYLSQYMTFNYVKILSQMKSVSRSQYLLTPLLNSRKSSDEAMLFLPVGRDSWEDRAHILTARSDLRREYDRRNHNAYLQLSDKVNKNVKDMPTIKNKYRVSNNSINIARWRHNKRNLETSVKYFKSIEILSILACDYSLIGIDQSDIFCGWRIFACLWIQFSEWANMISSWFSTKIACRLSSSMQNSWMHWPSYHFVLNRDRNHQTGRLESRSGGVPRFKRAISELTIWHSDSWHAHFW